MSDETVTYNVKLSDGSEDVFYTATFRRAFEEHPILELGESFKASMMEAALAFTDPNVHEMPIYAEGDAISEPIAYLKRL